MNEALEDQQPNNLINQLDDKFYKLISNINEKIQSIDYDKSQLDDLNRLAVELQSQLSHLRKDLRSLPTDDVHLSKLNTLSRLHSELLTQTENLRNSFI